MLKSLYYKVEFPSTGRSFENRIEFEPGLTAIIGRNESGKSLIVEMIEYCLFGKSALRGMAADYKNLTAELSFNIGAQSVFVSRKPKAETLIVNDTEVAVGAEALNRTIPTLLGFGLDVFHVTQSAKQDQLNDFTTMKPTARAQMVDDLTGLNRIEATERDCKGEAKNFKQLSDALLTTLVKPVEPFKPEEYEESAKIYNHISVLRKQHTQRQALLRIQKPDEPVPPEPVLCPRTEDQLEQHQKNWLVAVTERNMLERQLRDIHPPKSTPEQLTAWMAYEKYLEDVKRRGPKPDYDEGTLNRWLLTKVECPKCDHVFALEKPEVDLKDISEPPISQAEIAEQLKRVTAWAHPLKEVTYEGPELVTETEKISHARAEERIAIGWKIDNLRIPIDRSTELQKVREYNRACAQFEEVKKSFQEKLRLWTEAQRQLEDLKDNTDEILDLEELHRQCLTYESQLEHYKTSMIHYETVLENARGKQDEAEGFTLGAKALKNSRAKVKRELAPLLSNTASGLLYSLTNGERQNIVIDEDFNVWVDGQPLQTLSGSGKAVVNLSLRIGLGQVLTSKVMSLFIGDEIDGSMDGDRATATHKTFRSLTKHVDQVVLITHKTIEADHIISL